MKVLIVHESLPHPNESGCDLRLIQLIRGLRQQSHSITFVSRSATGTSQDESELEALCECVHKGRQLSDYDIFEEWFIEGRVRHVLGQDYDVAFLTLWFWNHITNIDDFLPAIRRMAPRTRVALLVDDRQGARQKQVFECTKKPEDDFLAYDYALREDRYFALADAIVTIAEAESDYVLAFQPLASVYTVALNVDPDPPSTSYEERSNLLFLADFANPSALDSINWFIEFVLEAVLQRLPGLKLTVAGHGSEQVAVKHSQNVIIEGPVSDLPQLFSKHRLFIAPTLYGTGVSTKVVLSMALGLPVVTTPIGCQSLGEFRDLIRVASSDPSSFADAVCNAYTDVSWWCTSSSCSPSYAQEHFGAGYTQAQLSRVMAAIANIQPKGFPQAEFSLFNSSFPFRDQDGVSQAYYGKKLLEGRHYELAYHQFCYVLHRWRWEEHLDEFKLIVLSQAATCLMELGAKRRRMLELTS